MIKRDGRTLTAKKWVIAALLNDIDLLTDFYYERAPEEWAAMSEKEQQQVVEQMNIFHVRIVKLLRKAKGVTNEQD